MNLLDAYVKEVISKPYRKFSGWCVDVTYTCWSDKVEKTTLSFSTEEQALSVQPGYGFLC